MSRALQIMLAELEGNRLEVQLVPCRRFVNEGGCYRVAVSKNATWYRDFCGHHASSRSKYAPELSRIAGRFSQRGIAA